MDITKRMRKDEKVQLYAEVGVVAFIGGERKWYTVLVPYDVPANEHMPFKQQEPVILREFWSNHARDDDEVHVIVHVWINRVVALPEDITPMKLETTL